MTVDIPAAFRFLFEAHRYKILYGGRGGGRSWQCARALLIEAAQRPLRTLCAREFQKSIQDSVHRLLCDQIDVLGLSGFYKPVQTEIRGANGSLFIFEGLRHNVTKIKSLEGIDRCWVEEAEKVSQNSWNVLIPTIRKDGSEIWVSFNPDQETDPTYRRFVVEPPPSANVLKTTWRDNPFFPAELQREKDWLWSVDPDEAAHVWDGECKQHSDAQVLHRKWRVDAFEPKRDWNGPYYGADWGMADPNTLVRFWITPTDALMLEHESWSIGVDPGADLAQEWLSVPGAKQNKIRADSARPETISLMCKQGFDVESAPKWQGSVNDGIGWLRSRSEIVIHDRCVNATREARAYKRKTDPLTGDVREEIVDKHNHIWDAVRYGAAPMIAEPKVEKLAGLW